MERKYAGFWWRFLAFILDQIVVSIAASILTIPLFAGLGITVFSLSEMDLNSTEMLAIVGSMFGLYILTFALMIAFEWLYYSLFESSKHQATIGKMVCGIIVTDMNGERIKFGRATGRFFGKILSAMIIYIGYIMAAFTEKKQALHDLIANTLVIKK